VETLRHRRKRIEDGFATGGHGFVRIPRSGTPAKTPHEVHDQGDQKNQPESAAAKDWTANEIASATEDEEKHDK
jgi:hypothetical protein